MKKILSLLALLAVFTVAFAPMVQEGAEEGTYRWMFSVIITIVVGLLGAPVTQFIKNATGMEDRYALGLTMVVAFVLAVADMFLSGNLDFAAITVENFPQSFTAVFSVMTIYYAWLKNSPSFFGQGRLLKTKSVG